MSKIPEIRRNSLQAWLLATRPKTLAGAAVPVMAGCAMAWADMQPEAAGDFSWTAAVLCLLFAFVMQIDANLINDFFDYAKGTDDTTTRLGPRRACAQGWVSLRAMRHAIALTTCLACAVGLPLVLYGGMEMVLVGMVCVVFCFLYTTHLSYRGLGDALVLVFFGVVPVCITYYIQLHRVSFSCLTASLACGLVIDALLIVNNYRDRFTDAACGKRTLVVRLGEPAGRMLYLLTGGGACLLGLVFGLQGRWMSFLSGPPLLHLSASPARAPRQGAQHLPGRGRTQHLHLWPVPFGRNRGRRPDGVIPFT